MNEIENDIETTIGNKIEVYGDCVSTVVKLSHLNE